MPKLEQLSTRQSRHRQQKKNCEIIHSLLEYSEEDYEGYYDDYYEDYEKWKEYKYWTLTNFGLYYPDGGWDNPSGSHTIPRSTWNSVWIIDEAFVRKYVSLYSADEFFLVYNSFNIKWIDDVLGYREKELYGKLSDTAILLLSMKDLFEVYDFHPTMDRFKRTASEEIPVSGKFNEGSDNHVVTKTSSYTNDTYVYEGFEDYTVIHSHGYKYDPGEYSYKNGVFVDIPSSFKTFSTYALKKDGKYIIQGKSSVNELECTFIEISGTQYIEVTVTDRNDTDFVEPYKLLLPSYKTIPSSLKLVK